MGTQDSAIEEVKVNGRPYPLSVKRLGHLLSDLGYTTASRGIAVALNGEVVPRSAWESRPLAAGDEIEIVGAVQGG